VAPIDGSDPASAACSVVHELERFSPALAARPRWLVLNKIDLIDQETLKARREAIVAALGWQGPVYEVSAVAGTQTQSLCGDLMTHLEQLMEHYQADAGALAAEQTAQEQMQHEARERIATLNQARAEARSNAQRGLQDDALDEDEQTDGDVDVEYRS
jgi:GTP-binding protein